MADQDGEEIPKDTDDKDATTATAPKGDGKSKCLVYSLYIALVTIDYKNVEVEAGASPHDRSLFLYHKYRHFFLINAYIF